MAWCEGRFCNRDTEGNSNWRALGLSHGSGRRGRRGRRGLVNGYIRRDLGAELKDVFLLQEAFVL